MRTEIVKLDIAEYAKCNNIWDMERQRELADRFYRELVSGNRTTYIYRIGGAFIGEISVVKEEDDPDYTIPGERLYLSRLIVKDNHRRQGIGRRLVDHVVEEARSQGYKELSVGVDIDNYPALKLYVEAGFDKVIFIGEDEYGKYLKLLKTL